MHKGTVSNARAKGKENPKISSKKGRAGEARETELSIVLHGFRSRYPRACVRRPLQEFDRGRWDRGNTFVKNLDAFDSLQIPSDLFLLIDLLFLANLFQYIF